jgi:hypothetical protein
MLGAYTLIPVHYAGVLIQFMEHGKVLAVATAYDDAEYADITARVLLQKFEQFDSVLIVPFKYGEEIQRRPGKEARKAIKKAYKEGIIS